MHIRSFIGAALLGLAMMASAPIAMADPAPDICVLDLTSELTLETAMEFQVPLAGVCERKAVGADFAFLSPDGDDEDAVHPSFVTFPGKLDFASARLHYDPGRLLA